MSFELPTLPYDKTALEPHMSAETFDYHHGKHHNAYVNKLNALTEGNEWSGKSLDEIIASAEGGLFNQAAQHFNHSFFWKCMKPNGGGAPAGALADAINRDFGSYDDFKAKFAAAAGGQFGSGWAWLVARSDRQSRGAFCGLLSPIEALRASSEVATPARRAATSVMFIDAAAKGNGTRIAAIPSAVISARVVAPDRQTTTSQDS